MNPISITIIALIAGFTLGLFFFWLLKLNSDYYLKDGKKGLAILLHVARFAVIFLAFWYITKFGALALLASFGGFLLSRLIFTRFLIKKEV
ncbi:MAG: ATP synthase subunit I [Emcibacteraceae bacterium]